MILTAQYALPAGNDYIVQYTVHADGVVHVGVRFTPLDLAARDTGPSRDGAVATSQPRTEADDVRKDRLDVPRIGLRMRLPAGLHRVTYFGRGPGENYVDRCMGYPVGVYETTAEEMYVPYVRPQENGHRSDTRWFALTDAAGRGLLVRADETVGFNALRNSVEDFDSEEADAPYQWNNFSKEEIAAHSDDAARNRLRKQTHVNDISLRSASTCGRRASAVTTVGERVPSRRLRSSPTGSMNGDSRSSRSPDIPKYGKRRRCPIADSAAAMPEKP